MLIFTTVLTAVPAASVLAEDASELIEVDDQSFVHQVASGQTVELGSEIPNAARGQISAIKVNGESQSATTVPYSFQKTGTPIDTVEIWINQQYGSSIFSYTLINSDFMKGAEAITEGTVSLDFTNPSETETWEWKALSVSVSEDSNYKFTLEERAGYASVMYPTGILIDSSCQLLGFQSEIARSNFKIVSHLEKGKTYYLLIHNSYPNEAPRVFLHVEKTDETAWSESNSSGSSSSDFYNGNGLDNDDYSKEYIKTVAQGSTITLGDEMPDGTGYQWQNIRTDENGTGSNTKTYAYTMEDVALEKISGNSTASDATYYYYVINSTKVLPELTVNGSVNVSLGEKGWGGYTFSAPEEGDYIFYTTGDVDTFGLVVSSDFANAQKNTDFAYGNDNFGLVQHLTKGEKRCIFVSNEAYGGAACSFTLHADKANQADFRDWQLVKSAAQGNTITIGEELPGGPYTYEWSCGNNELGSSRTISVPMDTDTVKEVYCKFGDDENTYRYTYYLVNSTALDSAVSYEEAAEIKTENWKAFAFTPTVTAKYGIYSTGDPDTIGWVIDAEKNEVSYDTDVSTTSSPDKDLTSGLNFAIVRNLYAGRTYHIFVRMLRNEDDGYSFDLTVKNVGSAEEPDDGMEAEESTKMLQATPGKPIQLGSDIPAGSLWIKWKTGENSEEQETSTFSYTMPDNTAIDDSLTCTYRNADGSKKYKVKYVLVNQALLNSASLLAMGSVNVQTSGAAWKAYAFRAPSADIYSLYTTGDLDTEGWLLDLDQEKYVYATRYHENDWNGNLDFTQQLEAGKTYYVFMRRQYGPDEEISGTNSFRFFIRKAAEIDWNNPKAFRIHFDKNDADATGTMADQLANGEARFNANTFTPRMGYAFAGWATTPEGEIRYADEAYAAITGDMTLYAKWKLAAYTIRYELGGGKMPEGFFNPSSYTIDSATITLNNPERTGYRFLGWYDSPDEDGNRVGSIAAGSTGDRTLYARWEPNLTGYTLNGLVDGETENTAAFTGSFIHPAFTLEKTAEGSADSVSAKNFTVKITRFVPYGETEAAVQTPAEIRDAGTYTLAATGIEEKGYAGTIEGTFTVKPAALDSLEKEPSLLFTGAEKVEDGENQYSAEYGAELNISLASGSALTSGDCEIQIKESGEGDSAFRKFEADAARPVGTYDIRILGKRNYTGSIEGGQLIIAPIADRITWTELQNMYSYTGKAVSGMEAVAASGDVVELHYSQKKEDGAWTDLGAAAPVDTGSYRVIATTDGTNADYQAVTEENAQSCGGVKEFTIQKAALQALTLTAAAQTNEAGGKDFSLTVQVSAGGVLLPDDFSLTAVLNGQEDRAITFTEASVGRYTAAWIPDGTETDKTNLIMVSFAGNANMEPIASNVLSINPELFVFTSVTVTPDTLALHTKGDGVEYTEAVLSASVDPETVEGSTITYTWNSSDPAVAYVQADGDGKKASVTARKAGTAQITVTVSARDTSGKQTYNPMTSAPVIVTVEGLSSGGDDSGSSGSGAYSDGSSSADNVVTPAKFDSSEPTILTVGEVTLTDAGKILGDGTTFTAETLSSGTLYEQILESLQATFQDANKNTVLSLSLTKNNVEIHELGGIISITLPVPAGISLESGRRLQAYRCTDEDGDGKYVMTPLVTSVKDGKVSFQTDHFSIYVIREEAETAPVYRLYCSLTGEHLFTVSEEEKEICINTGYWTLEGIAFKAALTSDTPVYRMYQSTVGMHFYTADAAEKAFLEENGWVCEGIAFYSSGTRAVYRTFDPLSPNCNHMFTADADENSSIILDYRWKDEGIGWYVAE